MHQYINPEILISLSIMKFIIFNKNEKYKHQEYQNFFIALMKFTSAFFCEITNMLLICNTNNVPDIIKDFVALGFIVEIDNQIYNNSVPKSCDIFESFKNKLQINNEKDP